MPGHELFLETNNVEIYRYINQFKLTIFYEEWMKIFMIREQNLFDWN